MIGISIAAKIEWQTVLNFYHKSLDTCSLYPFGEYFIIS